VNHPACRGVATCEVCSQTKCREHAIIITCDVCDDSGDCSLLSREALSGTFGRKCVSCADFKKCLTCWACLCSNCRYVVWNSVHFDSW
jgi:hypothetical protein